MAVPNKTNAALVAAFIAAHAGVLFWLPFHLELAWCVLVPFGLTHNALWSLVHEQIHHHLFTHARAGRCAGRLLAILFGSSIYTLESHHHAHHQFNRTPFERVECLAPGQSRWRASLNYYFFLCGGLYVAECLLPFVFWLPRCRVKKILHGLPDGFMARVLFRAALQTAAIRMDAVLIAALYGASAFTYGLQHVWILATVLAVRALAISLLDYIYHYGTPTDDITHALNLRLPRALAAVILNFNFHHIHHRNPALPWTALPATFASERDEYGKNYFKAALDTARGVTG